MRSFSVFTLLLTAIALFLAPAPVSGQGTDLGTIRGTVTDASGGVIPNAKVQITDLSTNNIARETTTDTSGNYEVFGLKSGNYKASISSQGFSTEVITGIDVTGSSVARADARLKLSQSSEIVEVSSEAPVIHTDDQTISQTLTTQSIIELPRDSRSIYDFVYLNPNITQGSDVGEFKFLGAQSYGGNFTLDGQRTNGGIFGDHTASQPSLEAVGELNILSNDFSAEYAGISNIRITTKRGGSEYHGSAFYNNKNSALAAWTLQDKIGQSQFLPNYQQSKYPNPFFNITDIGGSLGGPLFKKTYFFAAYERNWSASPVQLRSTSLPHPSLYTGDFSLLNDSAKPAVPANITLTADEIANNTVGGLGKQFIRIPQRLLNPVTQKFIQTYFPAGNVAAPINKNNGRLQSYFNLLPGLSVQDLGTIRLDHDFTDKDKVYVVYNTSSQNYHTNPVVNPFTGLGLTQNDRLNHTVSASYTRLISPSIVNEARGGFNQQNLLRHSNQTLQAFLQSIGFNDADIQAFGTVTGSDPLATFGHLAVNFGSGFQAFSNGGRNTYRPQDQNLATFGDTLTWIVGKHNLRMGADLVRNQAVDGFAFNRGNVRGLVTYSGNAIGGFSRFLMGLPGNSVSYVSRYRPAMDVSNWEQGYFVQDDWKVSSRLTVNLGLRYELITPFVEKNDLLLNFDPNFSGPNGQKGRFVIPSNKTLSYLDPRFAQYGLVTADQAGVSRGLVNMDTNNLAPRIGVAYRLTDKTVIRGGYGVYYPTSAAQGIRDPIATNPFNQGVTKNNSDPNSPLVGWPGATHGFSPLNGGKISSLQGLSVNAVPFDLHQPRIEQYNATVERELGWRTAVRLSYLGSRMTGLISGRDLNEIAPSDNPWGVTTGDGKTICSPDDGDCDISDADRARLPFPQFGDYLTTFGNIGHGKSNAFQAEVTRRYSGGLMFDFAYTYLDQKSTAVDSGNSSLGGTVYNSVSNTLDYGVDSFTSRHRVVAYGLWDVPVGRTRKYGSSMNGLLDAVVGGWQTTFNMFAKSGTAFTPYWTCDNCYPFFPGNIASEAIDAVGDFNNTSFRPLVVSGVNPQLKSGDRIFNPAAFLPPPVGSDLYTNPAVAKRNFLWGPGTWGVNLGIHKTFHFGERVAAQLGADANNVFNHPLFSPNQDYGGGGGPFAYLGSFVMHLDPNTGKLLPITNADVTPNPDFGRLINSFSQEGIDSRRTIRLRLRITF